MEFLLLKEKEEVEEEREKGEREKEERMPEESEDSRELLTEEMVSLSQHFSTAIVQIQALVRGFIYRRRYERMKTRREASFLLLPHWARTCHYLSEYHHNLTERRRKMELNNAGERLLVETQLYWYSHYLWQGVRKVKQAEKLDHELQRVFCALSLTTGGVDIPRVFKLLRDCKGLTNKSFTANTIELQFSKIKQGIERRMEYPKFLDFIANLAVLKFLEMDPTKTLFEDVQTFKTEYPSLVARGAPIPADPLRDKVIAFRFGSLTDRPALICKFVDSFITTLPDYPRVLEYLGRKSAKELGEFMISRAISVLQQFVQNRLFIRKITKILAQMKQEKIKQKLHRSAGLIQGMVKGFLGRKMIRKMAQTLYNKYVDGETEREYWHNPRTDKSFWVKPSLLGQFDCGTAVRMPPPDELFSVMCNNCERIHATCYCEQCDLPYCTQCFAIVHRTGQRKQHVHLLMDNCVQCEFQIGTRFCNTCNDLFCDSCFSYLHRAGRLRFHANERYCAACDDCGQRAARWKEYGQWQVDLNELSLRANLSSKFSKKSRTSFLSASSSKKASIQAATRYKIKLWCTVCYKAHYDGQEPVERKMTIDPPTTALEKLSYFGRAVKQFIDEQTIVKAKDAVEKSYQARKKEMDDKRREKCALFIQRVYRGYRCRKKVSDFVQERRALAVLRKKEDAIRSSLLYKMKMLFGFSIILESDTPLERVKKVYPWYMHKIVAASIENKWTEACKLLIEHEQHIKKSHAIRKPTIVDYLRAELAVYYAKKNFLKAVKQFDDRGAEVDNAIQSFYNAEASGAYGEAKLRKLKANLNRLEALLQKDMEKKEAAEEALDQADQKVIDIIGPRGLQILVEDRRRNGIPLPFRVRMRKNSSLALVLYPSQEPDFSTLPSEGVITEENIDETGQNVPANSTIDGITDSFAPTQGLSGKSKKSIKPFVAGEGIPGQWKAKLKVGQQVYIDRVLFRVSIPLIAKKRRRSSLSSRGGGSQRSGRSSSKGRRHSVDYQAVDSSERSEEDEFSGNKSDHKRPKKATLNAMDSFHSDLSGASNDPSGSEMGESASYKMSQSEKTGQSGEGSEHSGEEEGEEATEDHIQLDHPWLLDDVDEIEIFRLVPYVFYMKPIYATRRALLRSYICQKLIAIMAISNYKWSEFYDGMSSMFDDDSAMHSMLQHWSHRKLQRRDNWLRLSDRKVEMSYDFTLRRVTSKLLWSFGSGMVSAVKMLSNIVKNVNSGAEETPFEYWQRSYEKERVAVSLDLGNEEIALGDIEFDLKAPCEIMREYIHRSFREKLNESIGESFLFAVLDEENKKTVVLAREDEYRTYSKNYVAQKVDPRTFVSSLAVLLVKDKLRGRVFIPEFEDNIDLNHKEGEEDADDAELRKMLKY